ncbi:hypothetical protein GOODEAATRI_003518, partial [Goodea atripinnis]
WHTNSWSICRTAPVAMMYSYSARTGPSKFANLCSLDPIGGGQYAPSSMASASAPSKMSTAPADLCRCCHCCGPQSPWTDLHCRTAPYPRDNASIVTTSCRAGNAPSGTLCMYRKYVVSLQQKRRALHLGVTCTLLGRGSCSHPIQEPVSARPDVT